MKEATHYMYIQLFCKVFGFIERKNSMHIKCNRNDQNCWVFLYFLSADSLSSALLVLGSKGTVVVDNKKIKVFEKP